MLQVERHYACFRLELLLFLRIKDSMDTDAGPVAEVLPHITLKPGVVATPCPHLLKHYLGSFINVIVYMFVNYDKMTILAFFVNSIIISVC